MYCIASFVLLVAQAPTSPRLTFAPLTLPPSSSAVAAQAQSSLSYETTIARTDELIKAEDFVAALREARRAIEVDPTQFRGYYYAALALFEQRLVDESLPMAQKALDLAPAQSKADVSDLLNTIKRRQIYTFKRELGEQELKAGETARAAEAFTEAWNANKNDQGLGLRTAALWERLGDLAPAVRIFDYMRSDPNGRFNAFAQESYERLKYQLRTFYAERLANANAFRSQGRLNEATRALQDAIDALPDDQRGHVQLAEIYAGQHNLEAVVAQLRQAGRDDAVRIDYVLKSPELMAFAEDQTFRDTIQSVYGAAGLRRLEEARTDDLRKRQEAQARQRQTEREDGDWVEQLSGDWYVAAAEKKGSIAFSVQISRNLVGNARGAYHVGSKPWKEYRGIVAGIRAIAPSEIIVTDEQAQDFRDLCAKNLLPRPTFRALPRGAVCLVLDGDFTITDWSRDLKHPPHLHSSLAVLYPFNDSALGTQAEIIFPDPDHHYRFLNFKR